MRREVAGLFTIGLRVHDERRHPDCAEDVADVDVGRHPHGRGDCAGTCGQPPAARKGGDELGIIGVRRSQLARRPLGRGVRAPAAHSRVDLAPPFLRRHRPRVVRCPRSPREREHEREPECPVRVRGAEEHAHRRGLGGPEQDRPIRLRCVEHGTQVVHAGLQRRRLAQAIREPRPPLVEDDEPQEARQPVVECPWVRRLPLDLDVADRAVHEDQIVRAIPVDGIRDRHVPALRVLELVTIKHPESVDPIDRQRKKRVMTPAAGAREEP